jgi:tRNA threonylcarbamoyladenosine biosynthesis protein TsaE
MFMGNIMVMGELELMAFGRRLAPGLRAGSVLALTGGLGTGKTTLTRGIAEGLGVTDPVSSPTFTIINEYGGGRLMLYHFDVYRLAGENGGAGNTAVMDALDELGWEEYFYGDGVCVVEWADLIAEALPPDAVVVRLAYADQATERTLTIGDSL